MRRSSPRLWRAPFTPKWILNRAESIRSSIRPKYRREERTLDRKWSKWWRGKTANLLFVLLSFSVSCLRNQLGWRELSRDDRSGKSGELWKSSQACQRLKRVSVSSGIVGGWRMPRRECCFDKEYFKRSFFFRPLEQVCIKIFLLEMEF